MARLWRKRRAEDGAGHHPLNEEEREILTALTALRDTTAREVMTPRVDIVALATPVTVGDAVQAVRQSGHSRFPVYRDHLDNLVGVLFVKDLFQMRNPLQADEPIQRLRRPFLVPEGRKVLETLSEMRRRRIAFAVVVDEYGGVAGVITVKDLVSELVGELPDEFDQDSAAPITRIDSNRWLIAGDCPIDDVNEELSMGIPEGEYVTVGGFLFDRFGRIPGEGEVIDFDGWELRVTKMDRRRISTVVARPPSSPSSTIEAGGGRPPAGK